MADIGGSSQVLLGASNGLSRASSPSRVTLGGGGSGSRAGPEAGVTAPAWFENVSQELDDYSNAPGATLNGSPSPSRRRKRARYYSPPSNPPSSPSRGSNMLPPWAPVAGHSYYSYYSSPTFSPPLMNSWAHGPDPVSLLAGFHISTVDEANKPPRPTPFCSFSAQGASSLGAGSSSASRMRPLLPPGRSSSGASAGVSARRAAMMINPLGFSFLRSGGEEAGASEGVVDMEDADEEALKLTLGNATTRKDRA